MPNRDECYDAGKQIIDSEFGYVTSFWARQQTLSSGGAAVVAHGYTAVGVSSTTSESVALQLDDFTPCPMEFRLLPGQRLNFTLYDFGLKNATGVLQGAAGAGGGASDYYEDGISKVCHR